MAAPVRTGLMARLFLKEVDKAALAELQGMRFPAATGNAKVDEGYHMLYDYLRTSWDDSINELAIDYVRTFIGHGVNGFSAAYPFESVYTSERRLMMQGGPCRGAADAAREQPQARQLDRGRRPYRS